MPRLSWNEIQNRAVEFASRWQGETYEKGESQTFWSEFLTVFGVDRRRHGAFFEYAIKKTGGKQGFIDLFWPGKLLAEQKSAGRDLAAAQTQAYDYLPAMPDHDLPQAIVVCDFATFQVLNLDTRQTASFTLEELPQRVRTFAFLIEDTNKFIAEEDPVNRVAAENMAKLHNQLAATGYSGHDLEMLLVRLVFCMFADDALIFERDIFKRFIDSRTRPDGSDFGPWLGQIFQVLNTPEHLRQTTLDDDLKAFPYINGGLFAGQISLPSFNAEMRRAVQTAGLLDWSKVSPAIFGSMFQGVMDAEQRRNLGAHYTSERNIMRLIQPLFLDDLYAEFERVRHNRSNLRKFHDRLATLNFLDPACGCGNFLVVTYRELRKLEHRVVQELLKGQQVLDVRQMLHVNVDQMHGIDIEEFPSLIAQTALWLTDHQMNREASAVLGQHYVRLPLTASANVVHTNALTTDWAEIVAPERLSYILGNPPFIGSKMMTSTMRDQLLGLFEGVRGAGVLDFVSAWYAKSLEVLHRNPDIQCALVSTNSITQGEQVGVLWKHLSERGSIINFAHRTFKWSNDARGVAAVYCVIIGFGVKAKPSKRIFDYADIRGEPIETDARVINPYLVDAPFVVIQSRSKPISDVPEIGIGNKPIDGGYYLFSSDQKNEFIRKEPSSAKLFRKWYGAREFINQLDRWCLWLGKTPPTTLRSMPEVMKRIQAVRDFRLQSKSAPTRSLADRPTHFHVENIPDGPYILLPRHSSENRAVIPMGLVPPNVLTGDSCLCIQHTTPYHFGILTSRMHMAWVRAVCGRLKSDYRYSKDIVYNNFPWPVDGTDAQTVEIERLAQAVLDARELYPDSTLADLYDPLTMPPELTRAHQALDRAVDRLYRKKPFESDKDRLELLFKRYGELTS